VKAQAQSQTLSVSATHGASAPNSAFDDEPVDRLAVVPARVDVEILGFAIGISTPPAVASNQAP
jgi:hypothetical protein